MGWMELPWLVRRKPLPAPSPEEREARRLAVAPVGRFSAAATLLPRPLPKPRPSPPPPLPGVFEGGKPKLFFAAPPGAPAAPAAGAALPPSLPGPRGLGARFFMSLLCTALRVLCERGSGSRPLHFLNSLFQTVVLCRDF